jgi:signal transduction histidine kinase
VLEALCESMRLPYAVLRCRSVDLARHGVRPSQVLDIPLHYDGETIGELVLGVRSGQGRFTQPDLAVFELLSGPLALAVQATALSAALQESRGRIVGAREEERRRLRRDLHDGLGPALTGVAFKADAACNVVTEHPQLARQLVTELRTDVTAAIEDIRRLVDGLRPPALDELGLVESLRQHFAGTARGRDGAPVVVEISTTPAPLPSLPAAVEVAAYRIVTEALTNAVRHAAARRIEIRIEILGAGLRLEIVDDGRPGEPWTPGVGLTSMRERAAELGGCCRAGPSPGGGGRVSAWLPLTDVNPRSARP